MIYSSMIYAASLLAMVAIKSLFFSVLGDFLDFDIWQSSMSDTLRVIVSLGGVAGLFLGSLRRFRL